MHPEGFEEITNNCDIASYLFKFLNFSDQLRLSRVNRQLQNIFEQLVWKEKYQAMTITEDEDANYVVLGSVGTSPLILEQEEFQEFMNYYAQNVQELCVKHIRVIEINDVMWEFPNLHKIQYERVRMPMTHLRLLGKKCPNLEEVEFLRCSFGTSLNVEIGKLPSIKSLAKIRKLKKLSVENSRRSGHITYKIFNQVVRRLRLEKLKLGDFIKPEGDKAKKLKSTLVDLKELYVGVSLDPEQWLPKAYRGVLMNFQNLQSLTINCTQRVHELNEADLLAVAKTCQNLQVLKIANSYFRNIKYFSLPPNLKEFTLEYCRNLNCDNLKQLLVDLKCSKFCSVGTCYEGQLQEFEISPFIEILNIDYVATRKLKSQNLKQLTWYDDPETVQKTSYDNYSTDISKNLQCLHIKSGILPLETILKLEYLQTLTIGESMTNFNWSYFMALLKHSSLRNLSIDGPRYRSLLCERSDTPAEGCTTQIKNIKISLPTFRNALDFWLDLFQQNVQLTLTCNHFINFEEFLRQLLDNENFPSNMRTIEIWDISLNCYKLRRNFDYMMNKFMYDVSFIRSEYESDGDLYCLRLQR
ncbi:uncharacterized protein isoform X2 [Musca autumnalis]|uniref:uncharacterized protein isoform X1 n=1 Tax=Musca autumnalis TaxID=221902 RepID=UPI003CF9BAD5